MNDIVIGTQAKIIKCTQARRLAVEKLNAAKHAIAQAEAEIHQIDGMLLAYQGLIQDLVPQTGEAVGKPQTAAIDAGTPATKGENAADLKPANDTKPAGMKELCGNCGTDTGINCSCAAD